jgi:2',3'-cyclic-nucleotide 2'-phosphodiesterase
VATILMLGDICGRPGRRAVRELLPELKKQYQPLLVIANGENGSGGIGITPESADELLFYGVDVLTSGNHIWKKRAILPYLDENPRLLRPANYPPELPGSGLFLADTDEGRVAVINLQGRVFMPPIDCPFRACDALLSGVPEDVKIKVIDFHGEASSEKQAMGWYLDGRASVAAGTHTHVQTADERVLPKGTGYITDIGMTGSTLSVIGMNKDVAIKRLLTGVPEQFQVAKKDIELQGVVADIDSVTGKCKKIKRLRVAL